MTSEKVLVLNASYEFLTHISWQRAVRLVVVGKAVIDEAEEGKVVRHKNGVLPWPKVIRLIKYIRVPYSFGPMPFSKNGVLKRDNYLCAYCGKQADTVDHIKPQSRWPELSRDWMNLVASCYPCNSKKDDRTPNEAHMVLRFQPYVPVGIRRR